MPSLSACTSLPQRASADRASCFVSSFSTHVQHPRTLASQSLVTRPSGPMASPTHGVPRISPGSTQATGECSQGQVILGSRKSVSFVSMLSPPFY